MKNILPAHIIDFIEKNKNITYQENRIFIECPEIHNDINFTKENEDQIEENIIIIIRE